MDNDELHSIIEAIRKEMEAKNFKKAILFQMDFVDNQDMKLIFNVCDKTLWRWRKNQVVPFTKFGGRIVYPRTVIKSIMEQRMANAYVSPIKKNTDKPDSGLT